MCLCYWRSSRRSPLLILHSFYDKTNKLFHGAEISCEVWSVSQRGRSLRRLHADAAAGIARSACVSPCALVLAILYLERLHTANADYLAATAPADLFLVSLVKLMS